MEGEKEKICDTCQDFESNVGHESQWCPDMICKKCGQKGHNKIRCMVGMEDFRAVYFYGKKKLFRDKI